MPSSAGTPAVVQLAVVATMSIVASTSAIRMRSSFGLCARRAPNAGENEPPQYIRHSQHPAPGMGKVLAKRTRLLYLDSCLNI
jgi:hypothetical protein